MLYDKYMDQRPLLITSEEIEKLPILIVDKKGTMGNALLKILRDQFLVVIVTAHDIERHDNVIHIPYRRKIPMIPDNAYSHIFIFYNGETEILDMMQAFENKAEAVKSRFLFITSLLYSNKEVFKKLKKARLPLLQTIVYGETFDNAITEANEVNFFIHQVRTYGRIEVPKEGLGILYPVLLDDVLSSLVTLAFALEKPKEIIYLFPHHIYNEITVARIIQKIDPLVKVDFSKKKSPIRSFYIPPDGLYFFRDYTIEDRLRKINLEHSDKHPKLAQKRIKLKLPVPERRENRMKLLGVVLIAFFVAPILLTMLSGVAGFGFLALSVKEIQQGNISQSLSLSQFAQNSFTVSQALDQSLLIPEWISPQKTTQFTQLLYTGKTIAITESSLVQALVTMRNVYEGKSQDPKDDFLQSLATVKSALLSMQNLEAENQLPVSVLAKIHSMDQAINLVEETIDTWPEILGFNGKRTYLILFQNNMELRPGGGFIGSYGILPINNGQIGKLSINDVYTADGHLTQSIQPPYGLQRYLGVSHWFLRDSNFDPDFTKDSQQAAKFLQLETGQSVNGVIGIDTTFLKNIISVVGPVTLPDYHVTVTPDNFYMLTETNSEKNFFPGSQQKKDFLSSLTDALMSKLSDEKQIPYEKFIQMIITSLNEKDLLLTFSDSGVQNVYTVNDLSSSLWDGRSYDPDTLFDYIGVVDANIGTNKANYYVKRSMSQTTGIDDTGAMRTTIQVSYDNTSIPTSPFGGDYRDYVRFIIPGNATLSSVAINNQQVQTASAVTDPTLFTDPNFTPPPGLEIEQTYEEGENVIGFFFIVPANTTKTVSITYTTPGSLNTSSVAFGYNLMLFKEPGTGDDPYTITLSYPNDFTFLTGDKNLTNVGGKLIYEGQLSQDMNMTASFTKK